MNKRREILLACALAVLIGLLPAGISAQQIYVVATFDYPGPGNSTTLFGINERGDIVGDYLDSSSVRRGFVRRLNGTDLWRGSGLSDASK